MKKRIVFLSVLMVLVLGASMVFAQGTNEKAVKDTYTFRFATTLSSTSFAKDIAEYLKTTLTEKSAGRINLEIYMDSQMFGGDREIAESIQRGDATFHYLTTAPLVMFEPKMAVFDMPFMWTVTEDPVETMALVHKALDTPEGKELSKMLFENLEKVGILARGFSNYGFRQLTSNKEIRKFEDIKGLKVRTMENKYNMSAWSSMGANPTPMSFAELFTALEQGTIDGQENPYGIISTSRLFEVQKYLINTNHIANVAVITMSKRVYDSLPADLKEIVDDSLALTNEFARDGQVAGLVKDIDTIRNGGTTIISLPSGEIDKMRAATAGVWDQIRKDLGNDVVDLALKAIAAAK